MEAGIDAATATDQRELKAKAQDWEIVKTIFWAIIVALLFRSLLFEPFHIPSGSMKNTLLIGDYLFVNKWSYGYTRYSFPLSPPLFEGRVWDTAPERGDVAVFRLPNNPSIDYIKRVIGLPGDRVQMIGGVLHINGRAVERQRIDDFVETTPDGQERRYQRYRETLPNGVSYDTLDATPFGALDNTQEFSVPDGHYFMMGDNRDFSQDSRAVLQDGTRPVGDIPYDMLIGRASFILISHHGESSSWKFWQWFTNSREGRYFRAIN